MAKKRAKADESELEDDGPPDVRQPPLNEQWVDQVPEEVVDAVETYVKAMRAKTRAKNKEDSAKIRVIESMKEHGIKRVRIDDGTKWLIYDPKDAVKTESIQEGHRKDIAAEATREVA